ncbi:MAG: hypothetical protein ACXAC7_13115 [Candidatus Hodarchaeales archaeon]
MLSKKRSNSQLSFTFQFNYFWKVQEWLPFITNLPNIKIKTLTNEIVFEEITKGALSDLTKILTEFSIPNQNIEQTEQKLYKLTLSRKIMIPPLNFNLLRHILRSWYQLHTNKPDKDTNYKSLSNLILHPYLDQVRVISNISHPFWQLIEKLKQETKFDRVTRIIKNLNETLNWENFLDDSRTVNFASIDLNRWLHIIRHPTRAKIYLYEFFSKNKEELESPIIITTSLKLIDPLNKEMLLVTLLDSPEDQEKIADEVVQYWLTLGAIILRNLGSALYNISSIQNLKSEFKRNLKKFIESCRNDDLIESYKEFDQILKNRDTTNFLRTYEFITYNRGSLLDRRFKQAQKEYNLFPEKKILRKRVNARRNRLNKFLDLNLLLHKGFVEEALELIKASGNYKDLTSLNKILSTKSTQTNDNFAQIGI